MNENPFSNNQSQQFPQQPVGQQGVGQQPFTQNQANTKFCTNCGNLIASQAELCLNCGVRQNSTVIPGGKSRVAAGILAIFLGAFGVHKFYMGKIGMGILYLLFCWTAIPGIIGFIEGIIYLCESDEKFASRLNRV